MPFVTRAIVGRKVKAGLLRIRDADGGDTKPSSCDDIPEGSRAYVNSAFTHKRTRVKINIVDHSRQSPRDAKPATEIVQARHALLRHVGARTLVLALPPSPLFSRTLVASCGLKWVMVM